MRDRFDTRPWNLFVGLAGLGMLAGGCGGGTLAEGTNSNTQTTQTTQEGDECQSDADCPGYAYYCINGMCEYQPQNDGSRWYECFADIECGLFELCDSSNYCNPVQNPPSCAEVPPAPIPLLVSSPGLDLSFANVDADPSDELVVVSETDIHLLDEGAELSVTPHELEGPVVDVAGAALSDIPEDDILILTGAEGARSLAVYANDGMGGFGVPVQQTLELDTASSLLVGDIDDAPPEEVVTWGPEGALTEGSGVLVSGEVTGATYRPASTGAGGMAFTGEDGLHFFELGPEPNGTRSFEHDGTGSISSVLTAGEPIDVASRRIGAPGESNSWTLLAFTLAATLDRTHTSGVATSAQRILGVNFRGDMHEDLALLSVGGELLIYRDIGFSPEECVVAVNLGGAVVVDMSVGDHDGDGDEELALLLEDGSTALFDDEL